MIKTRFKSQLPNKLQLKFAVVLFSFFCSMLFAQPSNITPNPQQDNQPEFVEGELIIQITASAAKQAGLSNKSISGTTGLAALDALNNRFNVKSLEPVFKTISQKAAHAAKAEQFGLTRIYVLKVSAGTDIEKVIAEYAKLPEIAYAEPNYIVHADKVPNDPQYASQWALNNTGQAIQRGTGLSVGTPGADINAQLAWDLHTGDNSVIISILDTGVDYNHPEFTGRMVPGYDFINNDADPIDDHGHGTACAGIAAAAGDDGIGIAGVNWNSRIMPVKVLGSNGSGSAAGVSNGITWSADNGADVLSLSLGGGGGTTMETAVNYAHSLGSIIIASRGNANNTFSSYPASFANVMAIGAMSPCNDRKAPNTCDGETWWGSSYGADLDVMAPGTRIHTTIPGGGYTSTFNGTSAACPFVAGIAALIRSYAPALTNDEIRDVINSTAVDMGAAGFDIETGNGRADAFAALTFAANATPALASVTPTALSFTLDPDLTDSKVFNISNNGSPNALSLFWNITFDPSCTWLTISKSSGKLGAGADEQVTVNINTTGIVAGNHQCTLNINSNDPNDPVVQVVVDLNVNSLPPPMANITPFSLTYTVNSGEIITDQLTIANDAPSGNLNLHWSASIQGNIPGISINPTSGVAAPGSNNVMQVSINTAAVSGGNYQGSIDFSTNDPDNQLISIPVDLTVNVPVVGSNKIYVINSGGTNGSPKMLRMDLDGSNPALMFSNHLRPIDGDLDRINRKIYWFDWTNDALYKGELNGTGQTTVIGGLTSTLVSIFLDVPNNYMYYIAQSPQPPRIVRANLDGSNPTELIQLPGQYWVNDLFIDTANGKMYWTNEGVHRADLDGSNPVHLVPLTNYNANNAMAIDLAGGKVYWTQTYPNAMIMRANLADGSNPEVVISNPVISDFYSVDLDLINNKIYWSGYTYDGAYHGSVYRSDLQINATAELVYTDPTLNFPHIILDVAPPCAITGITAGNQSNCDPVTNTYTQEITVTYENAPGSGTLDVNGQSFAVTGSPQAVTLSSLDSDGEAVDVTASFSDEPTCTRTQAGLFTAPESCKPSASHPYVLLADERVAASKHALIEGNIHSNGDIELKKGSNSITNGNLSAVEEISVDRNNTVNGDLAADELDIDRRATINGSQTETTVAFVPLPVIAPFNSGSDDVEVDKNQSMSLSPGSYRDIDVDKNATLQITSGDYYAREFKLFKNATLEVDVSGGPVNLYLEDEYSQYDNSEVQVIGGSTEAFSLYSLTSGKISIRKNAVFRGNMIAPNTRDVRLEKESVFKGALCAKKISLKTGATAISHSSNAFSASLANINDAATTPKIPIEYALNQNYPNPFNPTTTIEFAIPQAASVSLKIFNIRGQLINTLVNAPLSAGKHSVVWDGTKQTGEKVASGIYLYLLQSNDFRQVRKMILLK